MTLCNYGALLHEYLNDVKVPLTQLYIYNCTLFIIIYIYSAARAPQRRQGPADIVVCSLKKYNYYNYILIMILIMIIYFNFTVLHEYLNDVKFPWMQSCIVCRNVSNS